MICTVDLPQFFPCVLFSWNLSWNKHSLMLSKKVVYLSWLITLLKTVGITVEQKNQRSKNNILGAICRYFLLFRRKLPFCVFLVSVNANFATLTQPKISLLFHCVLRDSLPYFQSFRTFSSGKHITIRPFKAFLLFLINVKIWKFEL